MFDCVACYYFTKKVSCIFIHWGHKADKQINIWFFCVVASLLYFMFCLPFHPLKNVQISCNKNLSSYLFSSTDCLFFFFLNVTFVVELKQESNWRISEWIKTFIWYFALSAGFLMVSTPGKLSQDYQTIAGL